MILQINYSDINHINYIKDFASKCNLPTFRYFQTRSVENAITTHILTLVDIEEGNIRGYAHIDRNNELGKFFLGICVLPDYQNKKIGSILLSTLLEYADSNTITLYLSVDKENAVARHLYQKSGFILNEVKKDYDFFMRLPKVI